MAQEGEDLALLDREVQVGDGLKVSKFLGEVVESDGVMLIVDFLVDF